MPQFEPTWIASQIFWLVIIFGVFYWLVKTHVVPTVDGILTERESRIQGDLELAHQRREQLEAMRAAYEADLAKARADAQEQLRSAQARMAEKQAAALDEVSRELSAQADAAEKRIAEQKATAMAELRSVAIEVAEAATGRLAGGSVDRSRIEAAIDTSMEAR